MTNAIFDEHKGVYRVTHVDGTFDTYTPTQFAELGGEVVIEEEEEIVVPDEKTPAPLSDGEVLKSLSSPELKEAEEEKTGIVAAIKNIITK